MGNDLGSEFPLVNAALSLSAATRQDGDDRDVSALRAAVGEPGLTYRAFDNLNRISSESVAPTPPPDSRASAAREAQFAIPPASPVDATASPASLPFLSAPPASSARPPPPQPAAPFSSGPFSADPSSPPPLRDDFAAFRAPISPPERAVPADNGRRTSLSDMFAVLRGTRPARRAESSLRDMFR
jgi:hypothetical protein